jgi:hypothetical protein
MAAPNLVNTTSIIGRTTAYAVTESLATTGVQNPANSNKLLRLSTIIAANKSAATVALSVTHFRASTHRYIASTIPVPANASIVILSKVDGGGLNLEEGDAIHALAGAAGALDLLISYEEIA